MEEPRPSPLYDEEFVAALAASRTQTAPLVPSQYRTAWRLANGYGGCTDATVDHIESLVLARYKEPCLHYSLGDWRKIFGVKRKKVTDDTPLDANEVMARTDMLAIVRPYLSAPPKQTKTDQYVALCPLHSEKTPSFTFNVRKKVFYCFGCGAKGSVFSFIMQIEGCDFRGALLIANAYGI